LFLQKQKRGAELHIYNLAFDYSKERATPRGRAHTVMTLPRGSRAPVGPLVCPE
jgi:hypothetical protein